MPVWSRRRFLASTLAASVASTDLLRGDDAVGTRNLASLKASDPQQYASLLANVDASHAASDPEQFKQSMRVLTQIYRESQSVNDIDSGGADAALQRVRGILSQASPWDPGTFADFNSLLSDGPFPSEAGKKLLDTSKFVLSLVDPPSAVVLEGESLVFDTNLTGLPSPADDQMRALGALAYQKILDRGQSNTFVGQTLTIPGVANVTPDSSPQQVFDALPDPAKAVCNATDLTGAVTTDQLTTLSNAMSEQVNALQARNDQFQSTLNTMNDAAARDRAIAAQAAQYKRLNADISAAINIGGFLVEQIFGTDAARKVTGVANGILTMANAIHGFDTGEVGALGVISTALAVTTAISSLFSSGPSFEESVLHALQAIQTQLANFQADVDARLSLIDAKESAILSALTTMYRDLITQGLQTLNRLQDIQTTLDTLIARQNGDRRQTAWATFDTTLSRLRSILEQRADPAFRTTYTLVLPDIASHATSIASGLDFVGADYTRPTPLPETQFAPTLRQDTQSEFLMGLLAPMCSRSGIRLQATQPANFVEWSRATSAYLEARQAVPDVNIPEFQVTLARLQRLGTDLRSAIQAVTTRSTISAVAASYLTRIMPRSQWTSNPTLDNLPRLPDVASPFINAAAASPQGLVNQAISEFLNGRTPGFTFAPYTTTPTPTAMVGGFLGPHLATDLTKAGEFYRDRSDFTVANDSIKRCKAALTPLIEMNSTGMQDVTIADIGSFHVEFFQIKVLYGLDAGKLLGGPRTLEHRVDQNHPTTASWWTWQQNDPAARGLPFTSLTGLLDYCQSLVTSYVRDEMCNSFAGWLANWLETPPRPDSLVALDADASTLRLFSALARLRKLGSSGFDGFSQLLQTQNGTSADLLVATDIRNIEGPFTRDELSAFLQNLLNPQSPLPPTTDWNDRVISGIKSRIQSCVTSCVGLGNDTGDSSSLAVVDDGLRALGAYGAARPGSGAPPIRR